MGIQVSASNSDLLLGCSRPFDPEVELDDREVTPEMNYGSAFAEVMAVGRKAPHLRFLYKEANDAAKRWALSADDANALSEHTTRAFTVWKAWAAGKNSLGVKFKTVKVEAPMAVHVPEKGKPVTRETKLDLETHTYDLDEGEIGGTPDVCLTSADKKIRVVSDDKTGQDRAMNYAEPSRMGQLRTLALMMGATHVAVFHSPKGGNTDDVFLDPIGPKVLAEHHAALRLAMSRVGDGSLRPGKWCSYCPAKGSCPANYGEMVTATAKSVTAMTKLNLGSLSESVDRGVFTHTWRNLEKMAKIARDMIKEEIREGAVIQEPDGRTLTLVDVKRESLSMTSIRDALGKPAGDAEIERLRKLGAIKEVAYEELRAK
jgi:Protein of unknown function (DUF2800)